MAKMSVLVGDDSLTVATQCSALLQARMQLSCHAFSESGTSATYMLPESSQGIYPATLESLGCLQVFTCFTSDVGSLLVNSDENDILPVYFFMQ